jgi:hypothetical protein
LINRDGRKEHFLATIIEDADFDSRGAAHAGGRKEVFRLGSSVLVVQHVTERAEGEKDALAAATEGP